MVQNGMCILPHEIQMQKKSYIFLGWNKNRPYLCTPKFPGYPDGEK
jgi:hypothetical protein